MSTSMIAVLFFVMIVAPCYVAFRSTRKFDDGTDPMEIDAPEIVPQPVEPPMILSGSGTTFQPQSQRRRSLSLREMAYEAEADAKVAQDRAEQAHWASLIAQARAAAIRADAAAEAAARAGREAEKAIQAAESEYLPKNHPSLDFPRSRVRRTAA